MVSIEEERKREVDYGKHLSGRLVLNQGMQEIPEKNYLKLANNSNNTKNLFSIILM